MSDSVDDQLPERNRTNSSSIPPPQNRPYAVILALLWTMSLVLLLFWNLHEHNQGTLKNAVIQARQAFEKDVVYRRWNAQHGGVYVPPTEDTPPNPYLSHIENRDITSTSGLDLTLINPAYMTRQVHELGKEEYGLRGHITSLTPLRPENVADDWETKALLSFELGASEIYSVDTLDGVEYMRYMHPLYVEESCLKCHADQGYKVNEVRGGISVSVPMKPLMSIGREQANQTTIGYLIVWILGVVGIVLISRSIKRYAIERNNLITALKSSEQRSEYINQVLLGIRNVNQLITKESDRDKLIQGACDNLTETFGYYNAWIALLDDDNNIVLTADSGFNGEFKAMSDQLKRGELTTCCQQALDNPAVLVTHDPSNDCKNCPVAKLYMDRSAFTIRLEFMDKVYGLMAVSVPNTYASDEEVTDLFHEVVGDIAFALYKIETEEALTAISERAQHYLDIAAVIIVALDLNGNVTLINKKGCEILGLAEDDIVGKNWFENFIPDTAQDDVRKVNQRDISGISDKTESFTNPIVTNSGEERLISWHNSVIIDKDGGISGVLSSGEDITEKQQAKKALQESEHKYRLLVENATDMIFMTDTECRVHSLNTAALQLLNKSSDDVIGKPLSELFSAKNAAKYKKSLKTVLTSGKGMIVESRIVSSGSKFWINTNLNRVEDKGGNIFGVLGVARDITDRKKAEREIRAQLAELKRWHSLQMDREDRIRDLKREVNQLHKEVGKPVRYPSQEDKS